MTADAIAGLEREFHIDPQPSDALCPVIKRVEGLAPRGQNGEARTGAPLALGREEVQAGEEDYEE